MTENSEINQLEENKPLPLIKAFSFIWEIAEILIVALAIVLPIRTFVVQPFFVNGMSMEPNFYSNEYLLIDEISYRFREPQRGEVIVFRYPLAKKLYYIKRIIGLPGETLKFENGKIIIQKDGSKPFVLDESSYLPNPAPVAFSEITLKANEYFVRGDNRALSYDSKDWGPVTKDDIIGRVWLRIWPINKVHAFNPPQYNYQQYLNNN